MSKAPVKPEQASGIISHRPVISARRHVISAGHYFAAHAGFAVLEAGGNAIDAGVAAGIALGVLQSDLVSVAGVAPIILYHAESRKVFTVSGLGGWPKLVTPDGDHSGVADIQIDNKNHMVLPVRYTFATCTTTTRNMGVDCYMPVASPGLDSITNCAQ